MNDVSINYRSLFALLRSLGFQEHPGKSRPQARVFFHEPTDTILAFGRNPDELVTPADMLSTEVHLHARGIVEQPLEVLASAIPVKTT